MNQRKGPGILGIPDNALLPMSDVTSVHLRILHIFNHTLLTIASM